MINDVSVTEFFENDVPSYGAYDNCRKISGVDGLKISMRKILFTMIEKYNGKEKTKTDTVKNVCAAYTNYLHGADNLGGVCDTMAQPFVGSNNYPLLDGNSSGFGTRINPTCAATRYTFIALSPIVNKLFLREDLDILERQYFEGGYIEPKYLMPIFPVLFLNGSNGLSTGFSQTIYPRNPKEIIKYINNKIDGKTSEVDLRPWFRGHKGDVVFNNDSNKYESFGKLEKVNMTTYIVSEIPIGLEYKKYVEILNKLCDIGTIVDYEDRCDTKTDSILFEIKTTREFTRQYGNDDRKLYEVLKLIKSLPENLCCIDDTNKVKEFNSVEEIIGAFIDIRLIYYDKRKNHLIDELTDKIKKLTSKYSFCNAVVKDEVTIAKTKKIDIVKQISLINGVIPLNGNYDYLLNMPIHSISYETLKILKEEISCAKQELKTIKSTTVGDMWKNDLIELSKLF